MKSGDSHIMCVIACLFWLVYIQQNSHIAYMSEIDKHT